MHQLGVAGSSKFGTQHTDSSPQILLNYIQLVCLFRILHFARVLLNLLLKGLLLNHGYLFFRLRNFQNLRVPQLAF